jgi:Tol biopolymer transport system component
MEEDAIQNESNESLWRAVHRNEMELLAARLNHEFQARWEDDPGPSKNIVENVRAKAKSIPAAKRFSSGFQLAGGVTVLLILGIIINFFVSQLRDSAPVANGTEVVSSFPAADRLIAFSSTQNGNSDIYTMHADGSGLTNITNNPAYDGFPHWSPDGKQIAFESGRDGSNQIYLMDADGSNVIQLTQAENSNGILDANIGNGFLGGDIRNPWSPDGTKLIFSRSVIGDLNHQFYVVDIATKNTVLLTKDAGKFYSPVWSPDGEHIAFISDETQGNNPILLRLYVADSQGTQLTNLTQDLPEYESVALADYYWSSDGTTLTFITDSQRETYKSTVYQAGMDGSRLQATQTNQKILDWWNDIALQTDLSQSVNEVSWSVVRPDGSRSSLGRCQSSDPPVAYDIERSSDGTLAFGSHCLPAGWTFYGANPDGTNIHKLLSPSLDPKYDSVFDMTWSPDVHYLAFMAVDEENVEIPDLYIINANDPSAQLLKMENSSSPSWQPVINENLVKEKSPAKLTIDPQSCKPAEGDSVPGELSGYDVIQNTSFTDGDFTYDFWLYCDPALKPEDPQQDPQHFSAIAGVGVYSAWAYTGPQVDGPYQYNYAFEPDKPFGTSGTDGPLYRASAKAKLGGINFDDTRIQESIRQSVPLQFLVVIDSSLGQDGAILSFNLVSAEQGYKIANVQAQNLHNSNTGLIAFTSVDKNGNTDIYTVHADGSGLVNLTNNSAREYWLAWSPDGTRLAFVSDQDGNENIFAINADGSNLTRLTVDLGSDTSPLWSPDGRKIAYSSLEPNGKSANLYVMDSDGKNHRQLTDRHTGPDRIWVWADGWGPDGQHIFYMDQQVNKVDIESGETRPVTSELDDPSYFTVNKENSEILYLTNCNGGSLEFCLKSKTVGKDGAEEKTNETMSLQQVCTSAGAPSSQVNDFYFAVKWSPDRTRILFAFNCLQYGEMFYLANADGSGFKPLLGYPILTGYPGPNQGINFDWSPDSQSIILASSPEDPNTQDLYLLNIEMARQNPDLRPSPLNLLTSQAGSIAWQPIANTELIQKGSMPVPDSIRDIQASAGFDVLIPTYLPKGYSFDSATYDSQTRKVILNYVSSPEDPNKMGTILIHEKLGDLSNDSELPVITTPVAVAGVSGAYSNGAWIYDSAGMTTPRWVQNQGFSLSWQKNGMSFAIDFIGGELTPPVGLDELTAIANSLESNFLSSRQKPTPEQVETSSYKDLVAFTSVQIDNQDIYTMRADGSQLTNITNHPANDYGSLWSPDGKKILFHSERTGNRDIFIMDADGSHVTQLTDNPGTDSLCAWSPDGTKILYETAEKDINEDVQLVVMDADGSHKTVLTEPGFYLFLGWSPDSRKIVYLEQITETDKPQDDLVVVMNTDGTDRHEWNFIVDRIKWVDDRHFIGDGWNGQVESPDLAWVLHRFSTDGDPPVEIASHSSRIVEIRKDTHVVAGGSILAWYTSDGSPAPFTSWNSSEVCRGIGDQFLPSNWTATAPDESKALIVIPCQSGKIWFYVNPLDGSQIRKLTDFSLDAVQGGGPQWSWSPDGKYGIMTISSDNGAQGSDLYLFDIEQMLKDPSVQPIRLILDGVTTNEVVWQPAP